MKQFQIRIEKASRDTYWYAHHIGEVFIVVGVWGDASFEIKIDKNESGQKYVRFEDCSLYPTQFR